jgi:hypothetical protein
VKDLARDLTDGVSNCRMAMSYQAIILTSIGYVNSPS